MQFTIPEEDKRAIDAAVAALYYVPAPDSNNVSYIELYADNNDTNEFLLQPAYDHRHMTEDSSSNVTEEIDLPAALYGAIAECYDEAVWSAESEVLRKAGFDPSDDLSEPQLDYLRSRYCFTPPYDHFLDQGMQINLLLDSGDEANRDFITIFEQYEALTGDLDPEDIQPTLDEGSSLSWLIRQQGYTMEDLRKTMEDYTEFFYGENADRQGTYTTRMEHFKQNHSRFLSSVCEELENTPNLMNTLTILTETNMKEFIELAKSGQELVFSKDTTLGIYSPWQGGGGLLGIELEKDLILPSELIWDIQVEGAKLNLNHQYSVNQTYSLCDQAWAPITAIREAQAKEPDKEQGRGASLSVLIAEAEQRSGSSNHSNRPSRKHDR